MGGATWPSAHSANSTIALLSCVITVTISVCTATALGTVIALNALVSHSGQETVPPSRLRVWPPARCTPQWSASV